MLLVAAHSEYSKQSVLSQIEIVLALLTAADVSCPCHFGHYEHIACNRHGKIRFLLLEFATIYYIKESDLLINYRQLTS